MTVLEYLNAIQANPNNAVSAKEECLRLAVYELHKIARNSMSEELLTEAVRNRINTAFFGPKRRF